MSIPDFLVALVPGHAAFLRRNGDRLLADSDLAALVDHLVVAHPCLLGEPFVIDAADRTK